MAGESVGAGAALVVDAVDFDLAGVLVDSEPVWEQVRSARIAAIASRRAANADSET